MYRTALLLLALLTCTLLPSLVSAGPAVQQQAGGYELRPVPLGVPGRTDADFHVYHTGQLVGWYRLAPRGTDAGAYWPLLPDRSGWGPQTPLPWRRSPAEPNYGIDLDRLHGRDTGESYRLNGRDVGRAEAVRAVTGKDLPDDRQKLRLTVIGDEAARKRVLADLQSAELASHREAFLVQDYPPGHWALGCGFHAAGNPTIYCQAPGGRVLHRQDGYDGPAALGRALIQARRVSNPNYRPEADPDLRSDRPGPGPIAGIPLGVLVSAACLVALLLLPK